jgi:hypothetical protein
VYLKLILTFFRMAKRKRQRSRAEQEELNQWLIDEGHFNYYIPKRNNITLPPGILEQGKLKHRVCPIPMTDGQLGSELNEIKLTEGQPAELRAPGGGVVLR